MAYTIPEGAILEIRLRGRLFNQVVINVFHYRTEVSFIDGDLALQAFAADFDAVVWSALQTGISDKVTGVRIDAQWVYPTRYRVYTHTPGSPTGGNVGTTTQTGTALVIKRWGEQANRKNQGRIYVYGVPINYQTDGVWTSAFILSPGADMVDAVKATIQADISSPAYPSLWSPDTPTETVRIIAGAINPEIRYQRRREVGVGQ